MALTPRQRTVLKDWAALRIANWVYTETYHEGVKQIVQVTDTLSGNTYDKPVPVMVQDSRMVDVMGDGPLDDEGVPTQIVVGQEEEFFMRRDYVERTMQMIDREEVITRLLRKARKRGMTDDGVSVRRYTIGNFFRNNRAYFHGLTPGVSWGGANKNGRLAARTEDPDA